MNIDDDDKLPIDPRALEVQRYVDGELEAQARTAFETRLRTDAALRAEVDALRGLRKVFLPAAHGDSPRRLSAGFRERVLAKALVAPAESGDSHGDGAAASAELATIHAIVKRWSKRAVIAAAVIAVLSLLVLGGALRRADDGRLEASEADVQKAMAELDASMRGDAVTPQQPEGR